MVECIKRTLELRVQHYRGEVARLSENRYLPDWNFTTFFFDKARQIPIPDQHSACNAYLEGMHAQTRAPTVRHICLFI